MINYEALKELIIYLFLNPILLFIWIGTEIYFIF